jgi:hypothetical protein
MVGICTGLQTTLCRWTTSQPTLLPVHTGTFPMSVIPVACESTILTRYSIPHAPIPGQDSGMVYRMSAMHSNGPASSATSTGTGSPDSTGHVRVVQNRPKPRCWEHGCNGRQFSTFSNLLRHQREKSGQAAKATCPNCGAEFTRTTARNGHLMHDKCKQRRNT